MRGNRRDPEDSVGGHMAKRGIRPSYSVDKLPGMAEEDELPRRRKPPVAAPPAAEPSPRGFGEELFSNGNVQQDMKMRLMELFNKGGSAQSFNEGLYGEDYRGMDHDFKGTLADLYNRGQQGAPPRGPRPGSDRRLQEKRDRFARRSAPPSEGPTASTGDNRLNRGGGIPGKTGFTGPQGPVTPKGMGVGAPDIDPEVGPAGDPGAAQKAKLLAFFQQMGMK